jgi:clan AA aspartic protease (TIGR02281 family)
MKHPHLHSLPPVLVTLLLIGVGFGSRLTGQTTIRMEKAGEIFVMPCQVNGLNLKFILDTGASSVAISLTEALFMLKNDYMDKEDLLGAEYYQIANGEIIEGTEIILREIRIGNRIIRNVKASITHSMDAPLLLGQSALSQLGRFSIDYSSNTLLLLGSGESLPNSSAPTTQNPAPQPQIPDQIPLPRMIRISGGTFQMGSNESDDEKPIHSVTVSSFYLAETTVTFAQYDYFCEQTGSSKPDDEGWGRGSRPVINVSWEDAQAYLQWLNRQTGQRYRLPTEAEWEYAAGGGPSGRTKYAGTSSEGSLGSYAVYDSNSGDKTQPVKSKKPNRLGLYDMSGNVWEWCSDRYAGDYYASSPSSNPGGPSSGAGRVIRGGSWSYNPSGCRVANRFYNSPTFGLSVGFRVALQF